LCHDGNLFAGMPRLDIRRQRRNRCTTDGVMAAARDVRPGPGTSVDYGAIGQRRAARARPGAQILPYLNGDCATIVRPVSRIALQTVSLRLRLTSPTAGPSGRGPGSPQRSCSRELRCRFRRAAIAMSLDHRPPCVATQDRSIWPRFALQPLPRACLVWPPSRRFFIYSRQHR